MVPNKNVTAGESPNAYDVVNYPLLSISQTHIGRLSALGWLFGIDTVHPTAARVLELGCGPGTNLLAMAQLFPEGKFVGVDYSKSQIELANAAIKATGIGNVQFLHADICELGKDLGVFDYIISHGVYSWIPDSAKAALLRISKENLSPNGIAYVSYNCLPGWKMRGALRDMMLMHTGSLEDPMEKVGQSKALLQFLASACNQDSAYGKFLSSELEFLLKTDDSYIAHEFLEDENDAFYFADFHRHALGAGLNYLGDAEPASMMMADIPDDAQEAFAQLKGNQIATEQYLDFLRNRTFRCSLLCHPELKFDRNIQPSRVRGLTAVSNIEIKQALKGDQPAIFGLASGAEIKVTDPATAMVLEALAHNRSIPVDVLTDLLLEPLKAIGSGEEDKAVRDLIGTILLRAYFTKTLDFYLSELTLRQPTPGNPYSLPLARWQVANNGKVSNYHLGMNATDAVIATLIQLCDGTRSPEAICSQILEAVQNKQLNFNDGEAVVEDPERQKELVKQFYHTSIEKLKQSRLLAP
jgi:methyltransferase-like protein